MDDIRLSFLKLGTESVAPKKPDGFQYWELVLCYVDDVLSVSDSPMRTMKQIKARFKLKDDKIEEPTSYLGAEIGKF